MLNTKRLVCGLSALLAGWCAWGDPAATHPPTAGRLVASAQRRFLVTGLDSSGNLTLAIAAEEIANLLESLLGQPIPLTRNQPIILSVREDDRVPRGSVTRLQGWTEQGLTQKLAVLNPRLMDQEDVLEALSWLLLNRYAIALQSPGERKARLAEFPDWLATGLAQNLYPALRSRNNRLVLAQWNEDRALSFEEIAALTHLPAGRWSEKVYCGAAVEWWRGQADPSFWEALFRRLAAHEPAEAGWFADISRRSLRDQEKEWELWMARQSQVRRVGDPAGEDLGAQLKEKVAVAPDEWVALTGLPAAESVQPEYLLAWMDAPWMPAVSSFCRMRVQSLALGADVEFLAVLSAYEDYFTRLARIRSTGWRRLFNRPARAEARLRQQLDRARALLTAYENRRTKRLRFVDAAAEQDRPTGGPGDPDLRRRIPRAELQRYVDAAEESPSATPRTNGTSPRD